MAEWSNASPWKGDVLERVPRVRIPLSPPKYFAKESRRRYNSSIMERLKSFAELPSPHTQENETAATSVESKKKKALHELMLEAMGVSPEDSPKLEPEDFFALAMLRCGRMGAGREFVDTSRRVILASTYQKAFVAYYNLKGPQKNVKYAEIFDDMYKKGKIGFIPHSKGTDLFLYLPTQE